MLKTSKNLLYKRVHLWYLLQVPPSPTYLTTRCVRRRVRHKHLIEPSNIPSTGQRVQGNVRRHSLAPLERTTLDTATSNIALQMICTSLDREVS
jgi:hypothetical protein